MLIKYKIIKIKTINLQLYLQYRIKFNFPELKIKKIII